MKIREEIEQLVSEDQAIGKKVVGAHEVEGGFVFIFENDEYLTITSDYSSGSASIEYLQAELGESDLILVGAFSEEEIQKEKQWQEENKKKKREQEWEQLHQMASDFGFNLTPKDKNKDTYL